MKAKKWCRKETEATQLIYGIILSLETENSDA
jgi:hypothetical protein